MKVAVHNLVPEVSPLPDGHRVLPFGNSQHSFITNVCPLPSSIIIPRVMHLVLRDWSSYGFHGLFLIGKGRQPQQMTSKDGVRWGDHDGQHSPGQADSEPVNDPETTLNGNGSHR